MNYETTHNILLIIEATLKITAGLGLSSLIFCLGFGVFNSLRASRKV